MSAPHYRLIAVVVLAVALAGCAADPNPSEPEPVPTATPTPTPSYQPREPAATLPLGCADLLALPYVQKRVPGEALAISVDERSAPAGSELSGFATAGGLRCVWGGKGRTDGGYDAGLTLSILGDGAADFENWASSASGPAVDWAIDTYGDRSKIWCDAHEANGCFGGLVVDGYWIEVSVRSAAKRSAEIAETRLGELLDPVVSAIRVAGEPVSAWTPPAGSYDGADLCDAAVATAILGGKVVIDTTSWAIEGVGITQVGFTRAGVTACSWSSSVPEMQDIHLRIYPGGAWMYPRFVAEPDEAGGSYLGTAAPVDIAGTDGALVAKADMVWSAMSIGGSLIEVLDTATHEPSNLTPLLQRIANHVAG